MEVELPIIMTEGSLKSTLLRFSTTMLFLLTSGVPQALRSTTTAILSMRAILRETKLTSSSLKYSRKS